MRHRLADGAALLDFQRDRFACRGVDGKAVGAMLGGSLSTLGAGDGTGLSVGAVVG